MSTFYFNFEEEPRDRVAHHLPTVKEAKCEAARTAGQVLCDRAEEFWEEARVNLTVADEDGLTLFVISISGFDAPVLQGV